MVETQEVSTAGNDVTEGIRLFTSADWEWRHRRPTPGAVRAFGLRERTLRRLQGGQGQAWTDGRLVLKPVGCVPEHTWKCDVYAAWTAHDEVRVPEPVAPRGGDEAGWTADRSSRASRAPVTDPDQVIHGDMLPNVLVADGLAPAVIDWPPYFRPAGMANAIAVTDAVTFRGAPMALLDEWETGEDWHQLLIRAMLYRLGPTGFFAVNNRLMGSLVTHVERASGRSSTPSWHDDQREAPPGAGRGGAP